MRIASETKGFYSKAKPRRKCCRIMKREWGKEEGQFLFNERENSEGKWRGRKRGTHLVQRHDFADAE